jgi:hypothetical protein
MNKTHSMKIRSILNTAVTLTLIALGSCSTPADENALSGVDLISSFDFESGHQDWVAGVSDFAASNIGESTNYTYSFYNAKGPATLPWQGYGLTITADNVHGDLFYFFKKQVNGLKPNKNYEVNFEFIVYTQLDSGKVITATEDIFLKVGTVSAEPINQIVQAGGTMDYYSLNFDKGEKNEDSGEHLKNLGSIKNYTKSTAEAISGNTYKSPMTVKSDAQGSVWLIIGVDSSVRSQLTFGLMAMTVYYTEIK